MQLNTLDRPSADTDIRAATHGELDRVLDFWQLDNASIIAKAPARKSLIAYRADVQSAILDTITRRPCTPEDLTKILGLHVSEINKYLNVLAEDGKIQIKKELRGVFYRIAS